MDPLFIVGLIGLYLWHSNQSPAPADGGSDSGGDYRVTPATTTKVVDNKVTSAASTVVEVANDLKIVATDGVDIIKSISSAWAGNDGGDSSNIG